MMNKKEAQAMSDGMGRMKGKVKNYAKNVAGGARIVGTGIKNALKTKYRK